MMDEERPVDRRMVCEGGVRRRAALMRLEHEVNCFLRRGFRVEGYETFYGWFRFSAIVWLVKGTDPAEIVKEDGE